VDSWVGFSPSPKSDPNAVIQVLDFEMDSAVSIQKSLALYTTADGLACWLGEVSKFDFRLGAKMSYQDGEESLGATYIQIQIPKKVTLVTATLGEVSFRLSDRKGEAHISASFRRAVRKDEVDEWIIAVNRAVENLKAALGV